MNILIFKTNICFKKDLLKVRPLLSACDYIIQWNIDQHDIDKVLRIVSTINNPIIIIQTITKIGYQCEELPD